MIKLEFITKSQNRDIQIKLHKAIQEDSKNCCELSRMKKKGILNLEEAISKLQSKIVYNRETIKHFNSFTVKFSFNKKTISVQKSYNLNYEYGKDRFLEIRNNYKHFKDLIKHKRSQLRSSRIESYYISFKGEEYNLSRMGAPMLGYVFNKPNSFSTLLKMKEIKQIYTYKAPVTKDNYVGIELEFFSKKQQQELAEIFFHNGLTKYLTLKSDNSIEPEAGYYGSEIAIICKESEYIDVITKVCNTLLENDSKINKSCGMHVHLDMRNRDIKKAFNNLVLSQPILYAMNPKSRWSNRFCKETKGKIFSPTGNKDARYFGINPESYEKHSTLEIRIHAGTLNSSKIINWVKLLLYVTNYDRILKSKPRFFRTFIQRFNIDMDLATYMANRIEMFEKNHELGEAN